MNKLNTDDRFESKVEKTESCWNWTAFKNEKGYGSFYFEGKMRAAHRFAFQRANGPIPAGMVVDHICQNPGCVRPAHLRLATTKQNAEYRRGAQANNKNSKVRGVYKAGKSWRVMLRHNQELLHFGCYPTIAEAEAVAIKERARLFEFCS